ncbi:MAG: hypothetical protein ACI31G_05060 [Bacilli bacterium]
MSENKRGTKLYNFFNKNRSKNGDKLPSNRFYAYFDILSHRFGTLIALSFLSALFFIPFFAFNFIWKLYMMQPIDTTSLTQADIDLRNFSLNMISSLISIPLLIIGFIGLGGLFYVIKKLVFQDPKINVGQDFFFGIKDNIKSSLLSGAIFSLFSFLYISNIYFYPLMTDIPSFVKVILIILLTIVYLFSIMLSLYLLASGTLYNFKFIPALKNNLMLSFVLYPLNLLFVAISALFFLLYIFIPIALIQIISLILIVLYGFSHMSLCFCLYAFKMFDKFINKKYSKEIVNKGLLTKEGE